jgi:hypothetical protein
VREAGSTTHEDYVSHTFSAFTWYDTEVQWIAADTVKVTMDGVTLDGTSSKSWNTGYHGLFSGVAYAIQFDDYRVRKYADPEPTTSIGSEEQQQVSWYDTDWSYRRAITLSPATSMANYQVLVTLTTATMGNPYSHVNADGSDIRFTGPDGTTLQDYWIESWSNTGTSTIWVEVAASGTSQIYMYYDNTTASSASNGEATFDFFDDFNDATIDTNKWEVYSGTWSETDGALKTSTTGLILSATDEQSLPKIFDAKIYWDTSCR